MIHLDTYPTELVTYAMPPTADEFVSGETYRQLSEKGLFLYEGLDEDLATQLVERSKEPHIGAEPDGPCPNDPIGRFANREAIEKWQAKGRLAMPLVRCVGEGAIELAGFGWMGPQEPEVEVPGAKTTFAIRLYESALRQRLAKPYTQAMLDHHKAVFGDNDGVWLEAWLTNKWAVKTYEDTGFVKVGEGVGKLHGVETPRIYMTLGELAAQ
jgi:hypothetical protein